MRCLLFSIFYFLIHSASAQREDFNSGWEFLYQGKYFPATVPGTIHTDLLNNKLIDDPFYRDNVNKLQWISDSDWVYRKTFLFDTTNAKHQDLVYNGLDTYADVFINGKMALNANNMFRTWRIDLTKFCKQGNNEIKIIFRSAVKEEKKLEAQYPYKLPGSDYSFTRKAAYQFGWDFAPRLVTCGIWKGVLVDQWNDFLITNTSVYASEIKIDSAHLNVQLKYSGRINNSDCHRIFIIGLDIETQYYERSQCIYFIHRDLGFSEDTQQTNQIQNDTINKLLNTQFIIAQPNLWTNDSSGLVPIYKVYFDGIETTLTDSLGNYLEPRSIKGVRATFGIRILTLTQHLDSIGTSFYFSVNGKTTYMKGANFVPPDMFLPRVPKDKYRELLIAAKDAHMNMLRVWGGGTYADDYFYDLCDSLGILVWQDFMFAGAMYPFGDSAFLENVKQECIEQVTRLRNHPCIAMWCGNNEIDEAWHNWDWQRDYKISPADSTKMWNDYKMFFDTILPKIVTEYGNGVQYISSSPQIGWGHQESFEQGDSHYWGVWWGMEPFSAYTTHVGRFVSEFGFQSLPSMTSIEKFTLPEDRNISSSVMLAHQTCNGGFEKLNAYMKMYHMKPKTFSEYINAAQQLQVNAMKTAIGAQMTSKKCKGSLMWQLNDCWPCASWSAIDYYGNKKPVYDELKILFSEK